MIAEILPLPRRSLPVHGDLLVRPPVPAEVVRLMVPTLRRKHLWLRRQGLRIAAGVGGASFAEVERLVRYEQEKQGLSGEAAALDLVECMEFVKSVRDEAEQIGRDPKGFDPSWGRSA